MPLNGSHVALGGTAVAALTQIYIYLTHWPLAAMDEPTAGAFAALTLLIIGGGIGALALAEPEEPLPAVAPAQPAPLIITVPQQAPPARPATPSPVQTAPVTPTPPISGAPTK